MSDLKTYAERAAALSVGERATEPTAPRRLKLTVDDLVLLDRHWQDDDHKSTELIDGIIYFTPSRYGRRARLTAEIALSLRDAASLAAPSLTVLMRASVNISRFDLPLPDIVLTSEPKAEHFIPAMTVALVVEIVESACDFFVTEKMRLYARAGIGEYWVVDCVAQRLIQFITPSGDGYARSREMPFGESVNSDAIKGLNFDTDCCCDE